jgi:hypothetical protein
VKLIELKKLNRKRWKLDEKVEREEGDADKEEEGAPREATTGELRDGIDEARGNYDEAGLTPAFVERARRNMAGQIPAEDGQLGVDPAGNFFALMP